MAIYCMNEKIVPLFSVPILYRYETGRVLSNNEKQIIDSLEVDTSKNKLSVDRYVLNLPGLEDLKFFCQDTIDYYAKEIVQVSDKFLITNSWTTNNDRGVSHNIHSHPNSIISGIFYFEADEDASQFIVANESPIFKEFAFEYHYTGYSHYNSKSWGFPVKTGTLVVFPSWLKHGSMENTSSSPRRLLGFNSFVRGKFGDFNYCSDVEI